MYNCFKSAILLQFTSCQLLHCLCYDTEPSSIYNCFKSTILFSLQAASYFIVCVMTLSHPLYITVLNQQYSSVYRLLATSLFVLWHCYDTEPSSIYNCFKSTILFSLQAASYFIVCVMTLSHPLYITVLNQQYCLVYRLLATSLFVL